MASAPTRSILSLRSTRRKMADSATATTSTMQVSIGLVGSSARWLTLTAIVVAGALGAFAIYTFGWHRHRAATSPSVQAQIARQQRRLIKLETTTRKDSQFLNDICRDYRAFRDSAYSQGEDRDIRYFVAVVRSWAVICDQDGIR
jgi:hypothetical protein